MKWINVFYVAIIVLVLFGMYVSFMDKITEARGVKENNCIEEESYYYRIEQGLIFSNKVETTIEKADGKDWRCLRWEEEPLAGKSIFGQKLIHEKGFSLLQDGGQDG